MALKENDGIYPDFVDSSVGCCGYDSFGESPITSVQEMDREEIEQSPNSDFSFDWGNKKGG